MARRKPAVMTCCVVALVLLSGCASFTVESTVNADGTIEEYVIEIDTSRTVYGLLERSAQEDGYDSLEESFRAEYNEDHIGGFEYDETLEGDDATITLTLKNVDPSGSENITVEKGGGEMTYTDRTFADESNSDQSSSEVETSGGVSIDYTLRMPGKITDSNADEVDGNTATWNMTSGEEVRATSNVPTFAFGPGFGVVPAVVGVLIAIGLFARRVAR